MALRLPKAELPTDLKENMIKRLGAVPENVEVLWQNPRVAQDNLEFGGKVGAWDRADAGLKAFAHMAVAAQVGCSWCLDVGYFQAYHENLDLGKASQVPRWRQSDVFTPLEREVLELAEAMTNTPPTVTDTMYASLLEQLGPTAMVELTSLIAYVNLATRANVANGVTSQGFSAACAVPLAEPSGEAGVAPG